MRTKYGYTLEQRGVSEIHLWNSYEKSILGRDSRSHLLPSEDVDVVIQSMVILSQYHPIDWLGINVLAEFVCNGGEYYFPKLGNDHRENLPRTYGSLNTIFTNIRYDFVNNDFPIDIHARPGAKYKDTHYVSVISVNSK